MSHLEHKRDAPSSVACAVVTVSDTRTEGSDESGRVARELLERAGHRVVDYRIIPDDRERIEQTVREIAARGQVQAVILNGGTGLSRRDSTCEALKPLLEKELPGFGELFRWLGYRDIGPSAMLSRALAGVMSGVFLCALPGSPRAVRLAMEELLLPELGHLIREIGR